MKALMTLANLAPEQLAHLRIPDEGGTARAFVDTTQFDHRPQTRNRCYNLSSAKIEYQNDGQRQV
ncbi:MAG: hypothetical protein ABNH02_01005 [Pseudomonadales bacterium]